MSRAPLVIAHRGASGSLPENTLAAYELAVEQRADMIEIDLHRTRDGGVVITHDEELASLGGQGEIMDTTLEQVRTLDAGDGERVPTLTEVLDQFGDRIPFNLELKRGTRATYEGMEAVALTEVERRGLLPRTLFSSFFDPVLRELRAQSPAARVALLISRRLPDGWRERAAAVGAEAINPGVEIIDREMVDAAHGEGLQVYVYTVDSPEEMEQLLDLGVDGLFTNHPARLRALVDARIG